MVVSFFQIWRESRVTVDIGISTLQSRSGTIGDGPTLAVLALFGRGSIKGERGFTLELRLVSLSHRAVSWSIWRPFSSVVPGREAIHLHLSAFAITAVDDRGDWGMPSSNAYLVGFTAV
jgi:hypothetical protein